MSDAERAANATTATSDSDFDTVCKDGSVSNAAAFAKPYTIVAFTLAPSSLAFQDDYMSWVSAHPDRRPGIYDTGDPVTAINVVACLTRQKGSEVRSGSCDFDSGGSKVTAEHYSVKWDVELREAKTGKTITNLEPVNGPAASCPLFGTFDPKDPKIYADPDKIILSDELARFARS